MIKETEYFYSRKELINLIRKDLGIDFNESKTKLSSKGIKLYE